MIDESDKLSEWEAALEREIVRWQGERSRIESELQRATKKLELVRQMKSLDAATISEIAFPSSALKDSRATASSVREMTQAILSKSERPLHINKIHKQFLENGYAIPGRGTPFNILAHLVNDKSFVRVARGTYALAGTVPQEQILPKAERKVRHRRRKKKSHPRQGKEER